MLQHSLEQATPQPHLERPMLQEIANLLDLEMGWSSLICILFAAGLIAPCESYRACVKWWRVRNFELTVCGFIKCLKFMQTVLVMEIIYPPSLFLTLRPILFQYTRRTQNFLSGFIKLLYVPKILLGPLSFLFEKPSWAKGCPLKITYPTLSFCVGCYSWNDKMLFSLHNWHMPNS